MTFTELFAALTVMALFLTGLSGVVRPAFETAARTERIYEAARETDFVIQSFRSACRSGASGITEWRQAVLVVNGLENISVAECSAPAAAMSGKRVWKMTFSIEGHELTVYAEGPLV